jgi:glycosyltransferase involved in cell wall biosynthesis
MTLSDNVRYEICPPVLGTRSLAFIGTVPDHTDIAPLNPRILPALSEADVIHTTDAYFAFARTARLYACLRHKVLTSSIHTDTPPYTRLYAAENIRRLFGKSAISNALLDRWHVPERLERRMLRCLDRHSARCAWTFAAPGTTFPSSASDVSLLRRGIDKSTFHPDRADRAKLVNALGISPEAAILTYAGRVDAGKEVPLLGEAARLLLDRGRAVHVIVAGQGNAGAHLRDMLGPALTLAGQVDQVTLGWLHASSDIFVFPSRIEVLPNAVLEAMAAGLPVVVAPEGGGKHVRRSGEDGIVVRGHTAAEWADAVDSLLVDPRRRIAIGATARRRIEREYPSWRDVLLEDLLPVWASLAQQRYARK